MENPTRRVTARTIATAAAALALLQVCGWALAGQAAATTSPANVAPSFDCAKATQPAEKLVCASTALSALDANLQKAYVGALAHVETDSKAALVKEQRNWIRYVRNICESAECLRDSYISRVALLQQNKRVIYDESFYCSVFHVADGCGGVVINRDPTAHIAEFNKSIKENGRKGEIIGCHKLVNVAIGFANSEVAFGAYCTLQNGLTRKLVMVCNDNMVGNFAMEVATGTHELIDKLVHFTDDNCFGG